MIVSLTLIPFYTNIPAINDLLSPLEMAFGDQVYEGDFTLGDHDSKLNPYPFLYQHSCYQ